MRHMAETPVAVKSFPGEAKENALWMEGVLKSGVCEIRVS